MGELEIKDLNRFTGMLLDYFSQETDLQRLVNISDARDKLDQFVKNNERLLLRSAGSISKTKADSHAKSEYKKYKKQLRKIVHQKSLEED